MLAHFCFQALWLLSVTAQLLAAMGVGIKWIVMSIRLVTFALLDLVYFIPHMLWYIFSPNIIRRVAYRSSPRTKRRNIEIFFKNAKRTQRRASLAQNGGEEKSGAANLQMPMDSSTEFDETTTAEQLASTINLADGGVMSALPINESFDALEHKGRGVSFTDAMGLIQEYYEKFKRSTNTQSGEVENSENISFEGEHSSGEEDDEEDRNNLHNRAMLDIYLPVPLDSLFRLMEQEKSMTNQCRLHRKKFPIIISVNGGAWIIGSYIWNFLIARLLSARGYVVFCPDYRNFPQARLEGMVRDVSDAVEWVLRNAERYNGDLSDVTLMGQSAGAHLTMMSLLSQAHVHAHNAKGAAEEKGAPSDAAYNVQRYNPRAAIHRYVGVSGIYNMRGLVKHFHRRGLYRSVLYQIAGGRANLPRYSLNAYFDERRSHETGETLPNNIFDFFPKEMFFIHGDADKSAPVSESAAIAFMLRNAQHARLAEQYTNNSKNIRKPVVPPVLFEFILVPGATHTDAIIEEPFCSNTSHVVEFLTYYDTGQRRCDKYDAADYQGQKGSDSFNGSFLDEEEDQFISSKSPDWKLRTPAPHCTRPWLIRLASAISPF